MSDSISETSILPFTGTDENYDKLPYRSVAYPKTHPAHLAAVAKLFELGTPDVTTANVLEFGCASGGNLIPLAARYPEASFTGVELSERQVKDGKDRIKALGLKNIKIIHGDISEISFGTERFDYIIAHGVYSWVPEDVQDAIFKIAAKHMSENAILYVSYNTFPGWNMRTIVRDICLYHAGEGGTPEQRVARARWALEQMATKSNANTPYGQQLRNEAKVNAKLPDSYILSEFLATHNSPCFFHEFVARAGAHDLHFFSESDISASVPEILDPSSAPLIRSIAGKSGSALEQYMDFFVGRQFRRSLLVKGDTLPKISRAITPDRLLGLHLSSPMRLDKKASTKTEFTFAHAKITVKVPAGPVKKLYDYFEAVFPETRQLDQILDHIFDGATAKPQGSKAAILKALFNMLMSRQITAHSAAFTSGRHTDTHPEVWPLAREEARAGQDWVSSRLHRPISVDKSLRWVFQNIDGTQDQKALCAMIEEAFKSGKLKAKTDVDMSKVPDAQIKSAAKHLLAQLLTFSERNGLLHPKITKKT